MNEILKNKAPEPPKEAPTGAEAVIAGINDIGAAISRGIDFSMPSGDVFNLKPLNYGLDGVQATYSLRQKNPMDTKVKFWLKVKW